MGSRFALVLGSSLALALACTSSSSSSSPSNKSAPSKSKTQATTTVAKNKSSRNTTPKPRKLKRLTRLPRNTTCAQKIARWKSMGTALPKGGYQEELSWLRERSTIAGMNLAPVTAKGFQPLTRAGLLLRIDAAGKVARLGNPRRPFKQRLSDMFDLRRFSGKNRADLIFLIAADKRASVGSIRKLVAKLLPKHKVALAVPKLIDEVLKQTAMDAGVQLSPLVTALLRKHAGEVGFHNVALVNEMIKLGKGCPQVFQAFRLLEKGGGIDAVGPALGKAYKTCNCAGFRPDELTAVAVAILMPTLDFGAVSLDLTKPAVAKLKDNDKMPALLAALAK